MAASAFAVSTLFIVAIVSWKTVQATTVVIHEPLGVTAKLGREYSLVCIVEGSHIESEVERIDWYHDDSLVVQDSRRAVSLTFNESLNSSLSTLAVSAIEREDGGDYFCQVVFFNTSSVVNSNRHTITVEAADIVLYEPPHAIVKLGREFNLVCQVKENYVGAELERIDWYLNDSLVVQDSRRVVSFDARENSSTFSVSTIEREDSGDYFCRVIFSNTSFSVNSSRHTITVKGAIVVIYELPGQIPGKPYTGIDFILVCDVEEIYVYAKVERIDWYHNDSLVVQDSRRVVSFDARQNSSTFSVSAVEREDGGDYFCRVIFSNTSFVINSSRHFVIAKGVFSLSIQPVYYVLSGSTVEVTCTVDGEPPPFIFWFNRNLRVFWNQYYSYDPDYGTIQMSNITEEDEGRYGCLGSNRYDQIFKHFSLVIIDPPFNTSVSLLSNNTIHSGMDIELNCSSKVNGGRPPSFTWIYNGVNNLTELSMELDSRYEVDTVTGTLLVREATYDDAGTYTCVASNDVGSEISNVTISIEGRPKFLINQSKTHMNVGTSKDAYLSCPFISNPAPSSVEWRQGSTLLQSGGKYTIFENNGTLHISNPDATDAGIYTCSVSNQFGSDGGRSLRVLVIEPPSPPTNFKVSPVEGDTQVLTMSWTASVETGPTNEVDVYVVEQSSNGGPFHLSGVVVDANVTSALIEIIQPEERYTFRVRARNIAGLSQPSNTQSYALPGRTYHYLLVKVVVVILCLITAFVALLLTISYWKRHDNDVKLKAKELAKAAKVRAHEENRLFSIINKCNTSNLQAFAV